MTLFKTVSSLALIAALSLTSFAKELAGISMPDQIEVSGKKLALNGMGLRKATFLKVKVYAAGLYLESKSSDANAILNSNGIKKLDMKFMMGVSASKIKNAWKEGFEGNCKPNCESTKGMLDKLQEAAQDMESGDAMSYTFFADHIDLSIKGKPPVKIEGKDFSKTLLAFWLGANPPNDDLKDGFLVK